MAGSIIAQLSEKSATDKRDQPWKAFISEPKPVAEQVVVEMVKTGGDINVMTNLLYVCIAPLFNPLVFNGR